MRFYRFNLDTSAEYEAVRLSVDASLGFGGGVTCIHPYATAPVDQGGRVVLALVDSSPGYALLVDSFAQVLVDGKAKLLSADEYDASLLPAASTSGGGVSSWNDLTDKPSTFTPSTHASTHAAAGSDPVSVSASQVSGLAAVATAGTYASLTGVPSTFAPSAHTHAAADIASGTIATARLASGTASSSTYLRGDSTWASIGAGGITAATSTTLGGVIVPSSNNLLSVDNSGNITAPLIQVLEFFRASGPSGWTSSSGTYTGTFPATAKWVDILVVNSGGGGGSGRRGAAGTNRWGGGGGAGGHYGLYTYPASMFGTNTVTVFVPAGGAGGAAVTTDDTNGANGTNGGVAYLSVTSPTIGRQVSIYAAGAASGNAGAGGTATSGNGGSAGYEAQVVGQAGGSSSVSGQPTAPGRSPQGLGGGGGGGISAANVHYAGGNAPYNNASGSLTSLAYGAPPVAPLGYQGSGGFGDGGAAGGGNGTDARYTGFTLVGENFWSVVLKSGAGGGGNNAGAGGNGGFGAIGCGGGGGGASLNGFASGAGGNGGNGYVRITVHY